MLHVSDLELVRSPQTQPRLQPFRLADLWDGSLLDKFLQRCASDPTFEPLLATRMFWGEVVGGACWLWLGATPTDRLKRLC